MSSEGEKLDKGSLPASAQHTAVHTSPSNSTNNDKINEKIARTTSRLSTSSTESFLKYDEQPWYTRVPFVTRVKEGPKGTVDDAPISPELTSGFFSQLIWGWMTPMMVLGYSRPLEATDLWRMSDSRSSQVISQKIIASFQRRHEVAEAYNRRLERGEISPGMKKYIWKLRGNAAEREKTWRTKDGRRKANLALAMSDATYWFFWSGGLMKLVGDILTITSPLLVKEIIKFGQKSYAAHSAGLPAPPIGHGIGLAFALLIQQIAASFNLHHSFYRTFGTGVMLRSGLIAAIYQRSLMLTSRARAVLSNGRLVNHISSDVSRIDFAAVFFHMAWTAPIQLIICMILLIVNLGVAALPGFALFIIVSPIQTVVMRRLFNTRKATMVWTDKRAKLLQELLGGMRVVKFFAWELPFIKRIGEFRKKEMYNIRNLLLIRSANNSVAFTLPVLAAVLSFITYGLMGHTLDAAVIFTSLTLFQLLRMPLMFMPMGLSAIADGQSAVERLYDVFVAEILTDIKVVDEDLDVAVRVEKATFQWDGVLPDEQAKTKGKSGKHIAKLTGSNKVDTISGPAGVATNVTEIPPERLFRLENIDLDIPRGKLTAIVGPVGSGKSSLLQGLIGEMRRTEGKVIFGGSVGYCPQNAWIQNATVRENICFGRPFEEERYWEAVRDASLDQDLDMLPNGDMTEVGEKGISLSGGQRQRLNICRAIYCNTDIIIFDDPFSALDAHVGKAVFQNAIEGSLASKTRILVTHALHFLPSVDHLLVMDNGKIAESGSYSQLLAAGGAFSKFVKEFGSEEEEMMEEDEGAAEDEAVTKKRKNKVAGAQGMMTTEERQTGAVSSKVYVEYFTAAHGKVLIPILLLSGSFMAGSFVMSGYWLVYWQQMKWPNLSQSVYMGIYAGLGFTQAIAFFLFGATLSFITYFASQALHRGALKRVLHAPMSFFDTTPLGRIMNRFAKDIDTIDNTLGDALRMLCNTLAQILSAVVLIAIILPWFLIVMFCVSVVYWYMAIFYRSSARELKRLDSILRSSLYAHFSESLSGLATIRAYGEVDRFRNENMYKLDVENRAYWLTVTNQRWLEGIEVGS